METDDDRAQFCRCIGLNEFEFVQINRHLSDSVFYTIFHGTVCHQDYFMQQIDSILKSYGDQYSEYGSSGINDEAASGSQQIAEMVFETYVLCPDGTAMHEYNYDGYGNFAGRDIYNLVADWNREFLSQKNGEFLKAHITIMIWTEA